MKKVLFTLLTAAFASTGFAQTVKKAPVKKSTTGRTVVKSAAPSLSFKNTLDSASYAFGLGTASNMKQGGITGLNYALLLQGFKDAFAGKAPLIDKQKAEIFCSNKRRQNFPREQ
jgi:hypothetical protein